MISDAAQLGGAVTSTKLLSFPPQFSKLAGGLNGGGLAWSPPQQGMPEPSPSTRNEPGWPRAPTAQELAWMTGGNSSQLGHESRQQNFTTIAGYLDTPYFDMSSLSTPSLYSSAPLHHLSNSLHATSAQTLQQGVHPQQDQQQPSAAEHLLSQLVSAAAHQDSRLQPGSMQQSTNLASSNMLLNNHMAALNMPSINVVHGQAHQPRQANQLEPLVSEPDADAFASLGIHGLNNTPPIDMASSGSLSNLMSAMATENGGPPGSSASLYVKNLSPDADELYLYQKFAPHGALLSCKVKTDPTTGKCRGVGFVNYVDQASALRAMQQLHGSRTAEGRQLHITLQAPRAIRAAAAAAAAAPAVSPRAGGQHNSGSHSQNELIPATGLPGQNMYVTQTMQFPLGRLNLS